MRISSGTATSTHAAEATPGWGSRRRLNIQSFSGGLAKAAAVKKVE